jgi:hypothetical protein
VANSHAQDANTKIRGGCEIIEVRSGSGQIDYSFCDKLPPIERRTYGWLVPVLTLAFDGAERATCGSLRCATGSGKVDLVVTSNAFANAGVSLSRPQTGAAEEMVFFLSTGLADMIQASTTGYLFESTDPSNGLRAWLATIDAHANSDCRFIVPAPFRSLTQEETRMVFISTSVMYQFVLGHEFAHVMLGSNCGVTQGGPLAQEMACDRFAFERQWQAQAMLPHFTIVPLVALAHYDSLLDERWGAYFFPRTGQTLKEAAPATEWISRARNVAKLWQTHCQAPDAAKYRACNGTWQHVLQDATGYLQLETPRSCHDTTNSRTVENQAAGSMEQKFCADLKAIIAQIPSNFAGIRGALDDTLDSGTKVYKSLRQLPGVDSCSVNARRDTYVSCDYLESADASETRGQFATLRSQIAQCLTGYRQTSYGTADEPSVEFAAADAEVRLSMNATRRTNWNTLRVRSAH